MCSERTLRARNGDDRGERYPSSMTFSWDASPAADLYVGTYLLLRVDNRRRDGSGWSSGCSR